MTACPNCGREISEASTFCDQCGKPVVHGVASESVQTASGKPSQKTYRNLIAVAIIMLLIGVGIGYAVVPRPQSTIVEHVITTTVEKQITTVETLVVTSAWQPPTQGEWKTIYIFTGSENKDTEDFNIPTDYWRIIYTVKAESEQYAGFYLYAYPSGETKAYVANVALSKSGTDISYIRSEPGDFYLSVLAANLESWTVEVQIQQ